MNAVARASLWSLAIALVVPLILFGAYFLHGSLEQFPADEQQGTARMVSGLGFVFFALLEFIVVIELLRKRKPNSSVVAAQSALQAAGPASRGPTA